MVGISPCESRLPLALWAAVLAGCTEGAARRAGPAARRPGGGDGVATCVAELQLNHREGRFMLCLPPPSCSLLYLNKSNFSFSVSCISSPFPRRPSPA